MKATTFFVYPYVGTEDDFELHCSMLGIKKNFNGDSQIVVVGDRPKISGVEFMHVESSREPFRAIDIHNKLQTIINDVRVPENFVWMYDDLYFINRVNIGNLKEVYALDDLSGRPPSSWEFDASKKWERMFRDTMDIVIGLNKPPINYETHLPRFLSKKKLQQLINKFDLLNRKLLFSSLYFAGTKNPTFLKPKTDRIKLGIYMPFESLEVLESKLKDNLFLNYSEAGYTVAMKQLLAKLFKPDNQTV